MKKLISTIMVSCLLTVGSTFVSVANQPNASLETVRCSRTFNGIKYEAQGGGQGVSLEDAAVQCKTLIDIQIAISFLFY